MGDLVPLIQHDFSGGVNAVANPYDVSEKQLQRIRNLLMDEHGSLRTRDGYSIITTAPTTANAPIIYRAVLNKTNGTSVPLAIQNISSTTTNLYRTDTTPWTLIGPLTTSGAITIPQTTTVVDQEIVAREYSGTPTFYDGTTAGTLTAQAGQTVPPGAKHLAFHLGSLWLWNTNSSTTTLDGPSSLRMSDANNPNSWPNANQTFISKDDGQQGMGLATFTIAETGISPTQTLVAFKNYSTYQVTGVFGATSFGVQKVKSDMGCAAPRTIQFVSGFGIVRLSHKGFSLFNGVDDRLISEEIRPYIFGRDDITGLNFSGIGTSWAVQSQNPPLYVAACPVSGSGLSRVFTYDLVRRTWSICDFPVDFGCLALFNVPGSVPTVHGGTYSTGQIVSLFSGASNDNGTPINWSFRTRPFYFQTPTRQTYWKRMIMDFLFTPTEVVTTQMSMLGQPNVTKTATFGGTPSASTWGTMVWGTGVWGATGNVDGRQSLDIQKDSSAITFDVSGVGPVRLRSLEVHGRPKPFTRAVR